MKSAFARKIRVMTVLATLTILGFSQVKAAPTTSKSVSATVLDQRGIDPFQKPKLKPDPLIRNFGRADRNDAISKIKNVKIYVIGSIEVSELSRAAKELDDLTTTSPDAKTELPAPQLDPNISKPFLFVPSLEIARKNVAVQTNTLRNEHAFVQRLQPFPDLIKAQKQELAKLKSAMAMSNKPGFDYGERLMKILTSTTLMFPSHRYLSKSFVNGRPAGFLEFQCCRFNGAVSNVLPAFKKGKSALPTQTASSNVCSAQSAVFVTEEVRRWCESSLEHFQTGIALVNPDWGALNISGYENALQRLNSSAGLGLARFQASTEALDKRLLEELAQARDVLKLQDEHLAKAKSRLKQYQQILDASIVALNAAKNELEAAQSATKTAQLVLADLMFLSEDAWREEEKAEQKAINSETAVRELKAPTIAICKGEWQPDCSADHAVQRSVNETQQKYLKKLAQLSQVAISDRVAASQKLVAAVETSTHLLKFSVNLTQALVEEFNKQELLRSASAKVDEDRKILDDYNKLLTSAELQTQNLREEFAELEKQRSEILSAGPMPVAAWATPANRSVLKSSSSIKTSTTRMGLSSAM